MAGCLKHLLAMNGWDLLPFMGPNFTLANALQLLGGDRGYLLITVA